MSHYIIITFSIDILVVFYYNYINNKFVKIWKNADYWKNL